VPDAPGFGVTLNRDALRDTCDPETEENPNGTPPACNTGGAETGPARSTQEDT
jgi:hypothetical protein